IWQHVDCSAPFRELQVPSKLDLPADLFAPTAVEKAPAAARTETFEPAFACGRCGVAGEFLERWQLCERCVDQVYGRGDPMTYVAWLLRALGQDTEREGLRDTPRRVVRMLKEQLLAEPFSFTTFA